MTSPQIKTTILLAVSFLFALSTSAQDKTWREIAPVELEQKTPKVEPDADAEAIFWEVRIDDSSEDLAMSHYVRVKIFTDRGREKFSKFDIPFAKGIKIKDLAARVVKPDGSVTEIGPADIFERDIVKTDKAKVRAKSFAVPNIEPGVIVEYKYREVIDDAGAIGMRLEFQKDIPVQTLAYYYKPSRKGEPDYQKFNFDDTDFLKDEKGFYLAKRMNIPAFKEEPRMPPEGMVRPWMILQAIRINAFATSPFSISYSIKVPGVPNLFWGSVAGERASITKMMNKGSKEIGRLANEVVAGAKSDDEKLRKLYEYAQTQFKNTSFDTSISDDERKKLPKIKELDDVLKYRIVSSWYVNLMFGSMAAALGYETRIVYSGDRNRMFFKPEMTVESFIHPAGIALWVGEEWKFFDPGTPFLPYGMMVWFEEDVWALLVGEKKYNWEQTPLTPHGKSNAKRTGRFTLSDDGTLEGDVRIEYTGQSALRRRYDIYEDSPAKREEDVINDVKSRMSAAEVTNVAIENVLDGNKPLALRYRVKVPNYAQKAGKRLFVQPGYFTHGSNPVFAGDKRKFDIYFTYPWSESDDIEIILPNGYELDNAERPGDVADPSNIGSLTIGIGISADKKLMKYTRQFHFGGGGRILFPAGVYVPLKNLFDAFQKSDTHPIAMRQK
jgi:hypothetical protein